MKSIIHKILAILFISLVLFSCEDVVQVDIAPDDIDLISVEAYLTTRSRNNVWVKVQKSLPIDNAQENPAISNAIVEIMENESPENRIVLQETDEAGIYELPENRFFQTQTGSTYSLKITTPDGVVITGEDYLQKVPLLDSVKVNLSSFGDYKYLAIFISTQETPGIGHFYKWDIYVNQRLLYGSENLTFANDELVDGNYISDMELYTDWFDEGGDNNERTMDIGDTIHVVQASISSDVYDFYLGMQNQAFAGGPFSVPPANVPGNLVASDGRKVLGLFTARDVSLGNRVVIDSTNFTPLERGFGGY
jgi:hypothetical protein